MQTSYVVQTPADFGKLIYDLLAAVEVGEQAVVLALKGDLGAGKTTFTQELAKALGVNEPVTSPTFTIMKTYELSHERFDQLVHIDAYRFEDEAEAAPLRLGEVMSEPRTIICLEWPERLAAVVPPDAIEISITINPDESRVVTISS